MLTLKTEKLELRGVDTKTSKNGNMYYLLYCEDALSGEPFKFFCRNFEALPQGLKKGDVIEISLIYNNFKELNVLSVQKVG